MNESLKTEIRPEVRNVLSTLRNKIRLYVCVEGLALILVVAGLLFWISFSIDWLWYLFSKSQLQAHVGQYELSTWFRLGFDVLAIGLITAGAAYWIGLKPFRGMRSKALALVLERRFPGLKDSLVTSVELKQSLTGHESPLTVSMLNRTVDAATQDASRIRVQEVFETKPMKWALVGAVFAIISVGGYRLADAADFQRWARAYLGLAANYWQRETELKLQVIAPPNERIRDFDQVEIDGKTHLVFKHPRGGDLTLQVIVPDGNNFKGEPFVIPEKVKVVYQVVNEDGSDGPSKTADCIQVGQRKFKFSLGQVVNSMKLWVVGGDFKNRIAYELNLVEPPATVAMGLDCIFPAYTGKNQDESVENYKEVRGKQVSVPLETRFLFRVETNKPLFDARVEIGNRYRIEFGEAPGDPVTVDGRTVYAREFRARLKSKGLDDIEARGLAAAVGLGYSDQVKEREFEFPIPEQTARSFFFKDKKGFELPFIVSDRATEAARSRFESRRTEGEGKDMYFPIRRAGVNGVFDIGHPFVMSPGADVRIYLEDTDEIGSTDPGKVTVNVDRDQPPEIKDLARQGIGVAVTPNAEIPISAEITDDYGILFANFEYRVATSDKVAPGPWKVANFDIEPDAENPPKTFKLHRTNAKGEKEEVARLLVSQIKIIDESVKAEVPKSRDLRPGDVLTLSVVATDGDNLNGPHQTRSVPLLTFRIVTDDELFHLLRQRETGIRLKFEKVIGEVEKLRDELQSRIVLASDLRKVRLDIEKNGFNDENRKQKADMEQRIKLTASRAKAQIVENRNETRGVQKGFEDIRDELVNNKLFSEEQAQRIEVNIINVLKEINDKDYKVVGKALSLYNDAVNKADPKAGITSDPTDEIQLSLDRTEAMLARMKAALDKMVKTQKIAEVIKMLYLLKKDQEKLKQATIELEKADAFRRLKELEELKKATKP